VKDEPGVLARVASVMAKRAVSMARRDPESAPRRPVRGVARAHDAREHERAIGATLKQLKSPRRGARRTVLLRIGDFPEVSMKTEWSQEPRG